MQDDRELIDRFARVEGSLAEIESRHDPEMHSRAKELVENLLVVYGEGLNRILSAVWDHADEVTGTRILSALMQDELVEHLLLLHDLHPVPIEERVAMALEHVRPYLASHGGNVELLGVENGVARLRMQGSCSGCPSSTVTLKLAIEEAIYKAAPDLDRIEAEGVSTAAPQPIAFVSTADLMKARPPAARPGWTDINGLSNLAAGDMQMHLVSGKPALFFNLEGNFYAYRDVCPECGQSVEAGSVRGSHIMCPGCSRQYDLRLAGRCLEAPDRQLEPIPLLVQNDVIKVAINV